MLAHRLWSCQLLLDEIPSGNHVNGIELFEGSAYINVTNFFIANRVPVLCMILLKLPIKEQVRA